MLAAIRPDSWNYALFLHVIGAMALVGALATAVTTQLLGWSQAAAGDSLAYARVAFKTLLFVGIPRWYSRARPAANAPGAAAAPSVPGRRIKARLFYVSEDGGESWSKRRREFGEIRALSLTPN